MGTDATCSTCRGTFNSTYVVDGACKACLCRRDFKDLPHGWRSGDSRVIGHYVVKEDRQVERPSASPADSFVIAQKAGRYPMALVSDGYGQYWVRLRVEGVVVHDSSLNRCFGAVSSSSRPTGYQDSFTYSTYGFMVEKREGDVFFIEPSYKALWDRLRDIHLVH